MLLIMELSFEKNYVNHFLSYFKIYFFITIYVKKFQNYSKHKVPQEKVTWVNVWWRGKPMTTSPSVHPFY